MDGNERANKVLIANIPIPDANKEVPWAIPKDCQWFTLQTRDGTAIRVAVESGHVANSQPPYFTIKAYGEWDERYLNIDLRYGLSLFFACSLAGKIVEVIMGIHEEEGG